MRQINCYIPIKVRITGALSDEQLDHLGKTVASSVATRLALAERTIQGALGGHWLPGGAELREPYDPGREDPAREGYYVPSYQGRGEPRSLSLQQKTGESRGWIVRKSLSFRVKVRRLLDYFASTGIASPGATADLKSLYFEFLGQVRPAAVWIVLARRPMLLEQLAKEVQEHYERLLPENLEYVYGYTVLEDSRQKLLLLSASKELRQLPDLSNNPGRVEDGQIILYRGGIMLFIGMALPRVSLKGAATLGQNIAINLTLRELDFIVNEESFGGLFGISWQSYLQEFGDRTAVLHLQPVYPMRQVPFETLKYLVEDQVARQVPAEAAYFGNLYLLNRKTLDWLPPAARSRADQISDDLTRSVEESKRFGVWDPDWVGAYLYAVVAPTREELYQARYRPEARRLVPLLLAKLSGDESDFAWQIGLLQFLRDHFGSDPSTERPEGGSVFEYVLAELAARGEFDHLFDKVEASGHFGLHHLLVRLALSTVYATNARVRQSYQSLNRRYNLGWEHTYRIKEQEIWLKHDPGQVVRINDIIAAVNSIYSAKKEEPRLKEASIPKLRQAVEQEAQELLKRILLGQDQRQYSDEEFAQAALAVVFTHAQQYSISDDDFEKVTIERSVRLLGLEVRVEGSLERIYVTYDMMEKLEDQPWSTAAAVPNSRRTQFIGSYHGAVGEGFEQLLWFWEFNKAAVVTQYFAIGVSGLAVLAVAWEVGLVAGAVELAGGWTVVGISIGISELFFAYRIIFKGEEFTWRGFFIAALDGYLAALTFRGAGFLGRGLVGRIGTESVTTRILSWIGEKVAVGVVGGASTAVVITFSHDLINIATGTGGWSSASQYLDHMEDGAVVGLEVELFMGAAGPLARVGGRTALETGNAVLQAMREGRLSGLRWMMVTTEALGNMRRALANAVETGSAENVINAFRERLMRITQAISQEYRLALFRRILELSPEALTRESVGGLEKFLTASKADLTNDAALGILNRLKPDQLRNFLEGLNTLDNPMIGTLARARQLGTLAEAPYLAGSIRMDPVLAKMILDTGSLPAEQAATRARAILAFSRTAPMVPETIQLGPEFVSRGTRGAGTSTVYEVSGRPDLLVKLGGGRLPVEAQSLIELEMMGIDTVYAATRRIEGQTNIVVRRIDGVGSKEMIGRVKSPIRPAQYGEIVTQRTIDDLERIYRILAENKTNVPDFQFIVRRSDGAIFVNDPANLLTRGTGPSGDIRNIIDVYKKILRDNMAPKSGG